MNDQTTIILTIASPIFLGIANRYIFHWVKTRLIPFIQNQRPAVQRPLVMIIGSVWAGFGYAMGFVDADFVGAYIAAAPGAAAMGLHWFQKRTKRD